MRIFPILLATIVVTAPTLVAMDAEACNDDFGEHYVVGVAADGAFVTVGSHWGGGSGAHTTSITIHDRDGGVVTTVSYCEGDCEPIDCDDLAPAQVEACRASLTRAQVTGAPLPVALDDNAKVVVARLKKKLGLSALKAGPTRVALGKFDPEESWICPVVAKTPDGPLTIGRVDGVRSSCDEVTPKGRTKIHRASPFAFVAFSIAGGGGGCGTDIKGVLWFRKDEVQTRRPYLKAMKLPNTKGGSEKKSALLQGVVAADPVFLPARLELARLLAETEVTWADAEKLLSGPLPPPPALDSMAALYTFEYFEHMHDLWDDSEFATWLEDQAKALTSPNEAQ